MGIPERPKKYTIEEAEEEVRAVLDSLPTEFVVRVHEGGGPEDVFASLAVSAIRLRDAAMSNAAGQNVSRLVEAALKWRRAERDVAEELLYGYQTSSLLERADSALRDVRIAAEKLSDNSVKESHGSRDV